MTTATTSQVAAGNADWTELRTRLKAFVGRRVSGGATVHDDLVQEILLKVHRGIPRLREDDRLDAFAYQVARNAITDHYRRGRKEQPVDPEDLQDHAAIEENWATDEEPGEGREQLARCLRPVVDKLDDDYREALLLTDLGDLSQAEAARQLGLSGPGMRSRVQRGRAQLQAALTACCSVELDGATQIDRVEQTGPCACS